MNSTLPKGTNNVTSPLQHSTTVDQVDFLDITPTRTSRTAEKKVRTDSHLLSTSRLEHDYDQKVKIEAQKSDKNQQRPSVKHLTCFWWKEKGYCKKSEKDCLYAHHDTGHYTDPPRQVVPGQPAKAGKALERALHNIAASKKMSSTSLPDLSLSEPSTPGMEMRLVHRSPSPQAFGDENQRGYAVAENSTLRTLVEQNTREKTILLTTIESLQADKKALQSDKQNLETSVAELKKQNEELSNERALLKDIVNNLRAQRLNQSGNPYGAIGETRIRTIVPITPYQGQPDGGAALISTSPLNERNGTNNKIPGRISAPSNQHEDIKNRFRGLGPPF